ncbi:MAG: 50S ribosomal protein L17 [Leptonema sp. (in: Bacteria)]|nr:50S ribosomal protein L17 [Leptonema sp. (in: bacteria)]
MKKGNTTKKLNRLHSHRKAMANNMLTSLFEHEQIVTTRAKAKYIRPIAEKMITRAKKNLAEGVTSEQILHNKREVMKSIKDRDIVVKLFSDIAPRFVTRNGGYLRIVHLGERNSDAASMAIVELVDRRTERKTPRKLLRAEADHGHDHSSHSEGREKKSTGVPNRREEKWYHKFKLGKKEDQE